MGLMDDPGGRCDCVASGRALRLRGSVRAEVDRLRAGAAAERGDLARVGVENHDGGFELLARGARADGELAQIGIVRIHDRLDLRIVAGIHLIAALIEQLLGRVAADAAVGHERADDVLDDGLGVVAVNRVGRGLRLGVHKGGLLRHGGVVLLLRDELELIHLVEHRDAALVVVFRADEGIIPRGIVRDAHDAGALRERQILRRLVEIRLRSGIDAVGAFAEVDHVQIPLHDLFLAVVLLELQRLEDLQQLALHGDIVLMREVFDELLRDCGAAEIVAHAEEHVHECAGRAVPVHALMLIEALILDRNCRMHQILGDLVILDPNSLFQTGKAHELLPAAVRVLIEDRTGERYGEILQLNVQLGGKAGLDVVCEDAHEQQRRHDEDQEDRPDGAED